MITKLADVVLGLTKPLNYQLDSFSSFTELDKWGDYFVLNFIMKNRYGGGVGRGIPMFFNYVAGIPEELDSSKWNTMLQELYIKKAEELNKLTEY